MSRILKDNGGSMPPVARYYAVGHRYGPHLKSISLFAVQGADGENIRCLVTVSGYEYDFRDLLLRALAGTELRTLGPADVGTPWDYGPQNERHQWELTLG